MAQLEPEQFTFQFNADSNSIGTIVKHLSGNMISRWTDFMTTDGEKPNRNRDQEFENDLVTKEQIMNKWNEGWAVLFNALDSLHEGDLELIVYIRNEGQTVMEAINRQLAHYPYHVGQIIFIAKAIKASPWTSLSIPRNQSSQYNTGKFSQEKTVRDFTESEIERLNK